VNTKRIVNIANGITSVELLVVIILIQENNFHSLDVLKETLHYASSTILENSKYQIFPPIEAVTDIFLIILVNTNIYFDSSSTTVSAKFLSS